MTGGSFRYLVKQGLTNLWLNRLMTVASVGILAACLILMGVAGLVSLNLRDLFQTIEGQNEMAVYVADNATEAEIAALESRISSLPEVKEYRFESKEEALARAQEMFDLDADLLNDYLLENPMPISFWLTLRDIEQTTDVAKAIEVMPSVYKVSAATAVSDTLVGIERVMLIFGAVIIGILVIASIVVIQNSIRLTVFARRREINIMKYVGATNGFIRLPFIVEGVMVGVIAALLAFAAVFGIYTGVLSILERSDLTWVTAVNQSIIPFASVWFYLLAGFLAVGVLLGAIGSGGAIKKYLKV